MASARNLATFRLRQRARAAALGLTILLAAALPLVGLASLLLRKRLDPHIENYQLHFVVFGLVGAVAVALGYAAGEAANRRGDARVLLLSLAFMATGGFLWLHAIGTPTILFSQEHSGFQASDPLLLPQGLVQASYVAQMKIGIHGCRDLPQALAEGRGRTAANS